MSVVIPTYNRVVEVQAAIDSVLGQTYPAIEVIVVDDGSTDGTSQTLERRYGADPRVVRIRQENGGVSSARNRGLEAFTGEYVCLLDSDDAWEPWKVELQLACFGAFPEAGMVWSDMTAVDPAGTVLHERYLRLMYHGYKAVSPERMFSERHRLVDVLPEHADLVGDASLYYGDIYAYMAIGNFVHTSTTMMRAERARAVGPFDERITVGGEDHEYHLRTCRLGPVILMDLPTIRYRVGAEDQLTSFEQDLSKSLAMAKLYLGTMSRTFEQDRDRIHLDEALVDQAFGRGNAWFGECLMHAGEIPRARRHLWRSVRHDPGELRVWGLLAMACMPRPLHPPVRQVRRALRGLAGKA